MSWRQTRHCRESCLHRDPPRQVRISHTRGAHHTGMLQYTNQIVQLAISLVFSIQTLCRLIMTNVVFNLFF